MFGAFKPSAPLSGGLLWKIPYRLSAPQKLRHRRRLRRVDNVVAVLDNALKRQSTYSAAQTSLLASSAQFQHPSQPPSHTPQQQTSSATQARSYQEARRHGRGPKQGDMLPTTTAHGVPIPSDVPLAEEARVHGTIKLLERWKAEMPTEQEMLPRDKYTMFDKKAKRYRKGVHKLPKWTRVSQRLNPPGF